MEISIQNQKGNDMNDIMKKYQKRLVDLNSRNMSLVMNRMVRKRAFDILSVNQFYDNKHLEIEKLMTSDTKVELLPRYAKWQKKQLTAFNRLMRKVKDDYPEVQEAILKDLKLTITHEHVEKILEIKKEVQETLNVSLNDLIDSRLPEYQSFFIELVKYQENEKMKDRLMNYETAVKSLEYLYREINLEMKETGISNLQVAFKFVEGKFMDRSPCRSPFCLLPVQLIKKNGDWFLEKSPGAEVMVNKVLCLAAYQNNQIKPKGLIFDPEEPVADYYQAVFEHYKEEGIDIIESSDQYTVYRDRKAQTYDKMVNGQLQIKPFMVLGRFPTANAIYSDYEKMIEGSLMNESMMTLLRQESLGQMADEPFEDIKESDYYFISNLDYSQERALRDASETNNLVVFGPPGTGKSQVLANVIADYLAKGKRVLMVSQKKTALDVIYNRLSFISSKLALIHDAESGKKSFYGKVRDLLDVEASVVSKSEGVQERINQCSGVVESHLKDLAFAYDHSNLTFPNGMNLYEMYTSAWQKDDISESDEVLLQHYRQIKSQLPHLPYEHKELKTFISRVHEKNHYDMHLKKEALIGEYPFIVKVNEQPDLAKLRDLSSAMALVKEIIDKQRILIHDNAFMFVHDLFKNKTTKSQALVASKQYMSSHHGNLLEPVVTGVKRFAKMIFNKREIVDLEEKNQQAYEQLSREIQSHIDLIYESALNIEEQLKALNVVFNKSFVNELYHDAVHELEVKDFSNLNDLEMVYGEYLDLLDEVQYLKDAEKQFFDIVHQSLGDKGKYFIEKYPELKLYEKVAHQLSLNKDIRKTNKIIRDYPEKISEIQRKMTEKNKHTIDLIVSKWDERFKEVKTQKKGFNEFKRLANFKRRFRSIREYFETYPDFLLNLFPCFLMGPETVSSVLPLVKNQFDVVIFDEASQMFVEEAIPSMFRGKKAVVAGDDKQLKPSKQFKKSYEEDVEYDEETAAALEEESLLDLAKVSFGSSDLKFHYRSRYGELINFSNYAFYRGELKLVPNRVMPKDYKPIERIFVKDALWTKSRTNKEEGAAVLECLKNILKTRTEDETIGIITFNTTQRELIQDMIDHECSVDDEFENIIEKERHRKFGDEDISLFIKNIENVQGDERDIIIFSTGYAKNVEGKLLARFGSLSQQGGENRLNVAISRAKKKIFVVTSFEPEALNVEKSKQLGPKRFKQYLQYVRSVSEGNVEGTDILLKSLSDLEVSVSNEPSFDSPFEMEVYERLKKKGYNVHTQVGSSGYRIDLAIYDEVTSAYAIGIECDGANYHSSLSARERDIHRQRFLESRGWHIERIWSTQWWHDREGIMSQLCKIIDKAISSGRQQQMTEPLTVDETISVQ